jgi:murein L,D-transpeptidase YafK
VPQTPTDRYADLCAHAQLRPEPAVTRLTVLKARRCLQLWQAGQLLIELPVIVGRVPDGPKECEGDQRTPEGEYAICYRNPESRFHRFLGLNYPNPADAARGLAQGRIDAAVHARLCAAAQTGERPDWYTPLGGEIGIHGGGIDRDGTAGCIALRDPDIELLWAATVIGTPVTIRPS